MYKGSGAKISDMPQIEYNKLKTRWTHHEKSV